MFVCVIVEEWKIRYEIYALFINIPCKISVFEFIQVFEGYMRALQGMHRYHLSMYTIHKICPF